MTLVIINQLRINGRFAVNWEHWQSISKTNSFLEIRKHKFSDICLTTKHYGETDRLHKTGSTQSYATIPAVFNSIQTNQWQLKQQHADLTFTVHYASNDLIIECINTRKRTRFAIFLCARSYCAHLSLFNGASAQNRRSLRALNRIRCFVSCECIKHLMVWRAKRHVKAQCLMYNICTMWAQ